MPHNRAPGARSRQYGPDQGAHLRGGHFRSSHNGYDCYKTGSINGDLGRIRIVLRPLRIPAGIRSEVRDFLPQEMNWPQANHEAAHACIDAVITLDCASMRKWKDNWSEHVFGFEQFLAWATRFLEHKHRGGPPPPVSVEHGRTIIRGTYFPTQVVAIAPVQTLPREGHEIRLALATFNDGSTALRITVNATLASQETMRLSRAYVDPITSKYEVIEHHPGRYKALNIPPALIYAVLGVKKGPPLGHINPHDRLLNDPRAPKREEVAEDYLGNGPTDARGDQKYRTRDTARVSNAIMGDVDLGVFPPPPA